MANQVARAREMIDRLANYTFLNDQLLVEALDTTGQRISQSNQRLALLGDAVLKHVVLDSWYPTGQPKGNGQRLVDAIGGNDNLADIAREIDLGPCVILHPGHQGPPSKGTLSTAVEAIIGAIYLDSGKDMTVVRNAMGSIGLAVQAQG